MPFCSQCGSQLGASDVYCGRCGTRQPATPGAPSVPRPSPDPLSGISPRTAAIFCCVPGIGWLAAIVVLASDKFRRERNVRFHAFQGLYLFVAWLMNEWVVKGMFGCYGHFSISRAIAA